MLFALPAAAQRPVSQGVEKRRVLLEQFTGIHCPTCPAAHHLADSLKAVKPPGSLLLMNIHAGAPALPYPGDPDFRTPDGNAIATAPGLNLTQYPSGTINKHRFSGTPGRALSPAQWSAFIDSIQAQNSSLNIAVDGTLNVTTRYLSFSPEIFLRTLATNDTNDFVSFRYFLVEDKVASLQEGASLYPARISPVDGAYIQNNVLRDELIGGIVTQALFVSKAALVGKKSSFQFNYTVPQQYGNTPVEPGNLRLLMTASYRGSGTGPGGQIVGYDSNMITIATGPITLTGFAHTRDAQITEARAGSESRSPNLQSFVRVYNEGSQPITSVTLLSSLNGAAPVQASTFNVSIAPAPSANTVSLLHFGKPC